MSDKRDYDNSQRLCERKYFEARATGSREVRNKLAVGQLGKEFRGVEEWMRYTE